MGNRLFLVAAFNFIFSLSFSQNKIPLDHSVYDGWKSIKENNISNNGNYVKYVADPQDGDGVLYLYNSNSKNSTAFQRGKGSEFSYNSNFLIFKIAPYNDSIKAEKRRKLDAEKQTKDSLGIFDMRTETLIKVPRVKSFGLPEKSGEWLVYQLEPELPVKDTVANDSTKTKDLADAVMQSNKKKKKDDEGSALIIRNLASGTSYTFPKVASYKLSKYGDAVVFHSTGDSSLAAGVYLFNTKEGAAKKISSGEGKYQQLTVHQKGEQVAFVANKDTGDVKRRIFDLYYWKEKEDSAKVLVDTATFFDIKKSWTASEHGKIEFSEDGSKLYFGVAPLKPAPEEDSLLDSEKPQLDVWSWLDPVIQPQQLKQREEEEKKTYSAVIHLKNKKIVQLADESMPWIRFTKEANAKYAAGYSDSGYQSLRSWSGWYYDGYLVNVETGERTRILQQEQGTPHISPDAQFLYWYDNDEKSWYTYHIKKGQKIKLTAAIPVNFYNELNDIPADPGSYGAAGFTKDDKHFLVYDNFDIWVTDPEGKEKAWKLTNGRDQRLRYRYTNLSPDTPYIHIKNPIYLSVFDEKNKSEGYAVVDFKQDAVVKHLLKNDHNYMDLKKADFSNNVIYRRSTFQEYSDIWYGTLSFNDPEKISNINPQQEQYLWGSVELVRWKSASGDTLEGKIYYPANFNPQQKYPMIIYFYERLSDELHKHFVPSPSRSVINPSYYTSNGYIVFMPDIKYRVGYPGESAMDAIVSGALFLSQKGFVDINNIGIQGQSWGGYQVAYLVTRTNMFKAAMAGAPVSNMTSAYGGIRWESGLSRMFQYEAGQSRIGQTLWENPYLYIENSPLFKADQINTPLLIMANDNDGAVPWYQGIELFMALKRQQKPVWLLNYNNDAHNLMKRPNMIDLSIRMQQYFDHYLKGAPAPEWMVKGIPAVEKGRVKGYELMED